MRIDIIPPPGDRFPRRDEPIRIGVPLAHGRLLDPNRLKLWDASGHPRPIVGRILDRWSDGSIRWLLLDFQADHDGRDDDQAYELHLESETAAPTAPTLHATEEDRDAHDRHWRGAVPASRRRTVSVPSRAHQRRRSYRRVGHGADRQGCPGPPRQRDDVGARSRGNQRAADRGQGRRLGDNVRARPADPKPGTDAFHRWLRNRALRGDAPQSPACRARRRLLGARRHRLDPAP